MVGLGRDMYGIGVLGNFSSVDRGWMKGEGEVSEHILLRVGSIS